MASVTDGFRYDVFLSFRGEDTRYGFTGNLLKALNDRGIRTFMDDEELQKGEEITPSLLKAIEESRIAIIVLSKNYASSSFCLQELSTILDCSSIKEKRRLVWPVFYEVDPSDVRKLKGTYRRAMAMHESRSNADMDWLQKLMKARSNSNMDRLQKWKNALHEVADLSGFHYKKGDGYEHEFIGKIVERVSREIKPVTLPIADYLVGVEPQRQNVTLLLNVGSDDDRVHMVGIHGIAGIGKTTLALAVYNLIARQFEGLCFLEKIRENSEIHGLLYLQKILLSDVVGEKKIELTSVKQGISVIQQRLRQKKVLLILDDVDKQEQLQALVGRPEWFGPGSRVIITTRDKHLLTYHGVESTYGMKELNQEDAFELLIWKAFKTDKVSPSYANVLNRARAITYASRLPLDLEVIGSHLFKKGIEEWESTLDQYERIPNKDIENILKVSSDALLEEEMEASPKQSSQVEYLRLWNCNLSDESLAVGLKWFANVKELDLRGSNLSILPECIGKCLCLWKLVLDNCEKLQDISGIPPCLKTLCALNCISLTSSCKRKLLNQELHETGNTWFRLPRANFPDWFEHRWMAGNSISFWFCNKFPAIALCVVSQWTWGNYDRPVRVIINGNTFFHNDAENKYAWSKVPHIHLFHMKMEKFNDNPDKALLENKWNHAEVDFGFPFQLSGIHVLKEKSSVKDIRFTNPENDANVEIFPPLELPSQEQLDLLYCDNPEIFQKIIEQMEASPKQSSQVEFLSLWNGKLSDESLAVGLKWFANVKELDLRGSKLSVLPECIGKCLCLWKLVLDNCEKLQDISGIPPCLKTLCALNCISLTLIEM